MKKFIISFLFISFGVYALDRAGGEVMRWVCLNTHNSSAPKMRYFVYEPKDDILFMGTSRCNNHYVSSIIQDSLGMSVYNGGITAAGNIYSHYILLNLMDTKLCPLTRNKPQVICLDVWEQDILPDHGTTSFNSISFFAPYFGLNNNADSVYMQNGTYEMYKLSHLYRYNAKAVQNIAGLFINMETASNNGYTPLPTPHYSPKNLCYNKSQKLKDADKLEYLGKFIKKCNKDGVNLIFVISPMYQKVDTDYYDVLKNFASENNVPVLDYHSTGLFWDHPEYFSGNKHLIDLGAREYSSIVAHDLKQLLCNHNFVPIK